MGNYKKTIISRYYRSVNIHITKPSMGFLQSLRFYHKSPNTRKNPLRRRWPHENNYGVGMKYDDTSWHYGGDFPENLPDTAGATHIGMFVAWCLLNGLAGAIHLDDFPEELENLKERKLTPGAWFIQAVDEKFTDEDLSEEGNKFTEFYYDFDNGNYLGDYESSVGQGLESTYEVPNTWDAYDQLSPVIQKRFDAWKAQG